MVRLPIQPELWPKFHRLRARTAGGVRPLTRRGADRDRLPPVLRSGDWAVFECGSEASNNQ